MKDKIMFLGHNPSDAGSRRNDPTSFKLCKFALAWGYKGFVLKNVMDRIADKPEKLKAMDARGIISPANLRDIIASAELVDKIVCCWGNVLPAFQSFADLLEQRLRDEGYMLYCLDENADGSPKHPLYVGDNAKLKLWHGNLK